MTPIKIKNFTRLIARKALISAVGIAVTARTIFCFAVPSNISAQQIGADTATIAVNEAHVAYSPYNWYQNGSSYAQTPNPGAYLKLGFTGTSLAVNLDVTPLAAASVPAAQYPLVRYTVDNQQPVTVQLSASSTRIQCAAGLASGKHTLKLQYVAGYVFLDFWTPINVVRVTGFTVDKGAGAIAPFGGCAVQPKSVLFLGDSITNGDNTVATFAQGITNAVGTQDATVGYPQPVAATIGAEYGIVAYGGASWDRMAADGRTPGLMTFFSRLDATHSRLSSGRFSPIPSDVFVNMGENSGPAPGDVSSLLTSLRADTSPSTNLFIIVPFSGRQRATLASGFASFQMAHPQDAHAYLLDLGNNPYLTDSGATKLSVDGQHPLAALDSMLGTQLIQARQAALGEATLGTK